MYRSGMTATESTPERLDEMPLWRLLVLLNDLEREVGPASPTSRLVARLVSERLRGEPAATKRRARRGR
jgi:hypothetical protein